MGEEWIIRVGERRALLALVLIVVAADCRSKSAPERAMADYVVAVREHRCDAAMSFLSMRSRHAIESLTIRPQHPHVDVPIEHYYCYDLMFEDCKVDKMTLTSQREQSAAVSMPCGRAQDSFLPGFPSPFLKYGPRVSEMVREQGEWYVELSYPIEIIERREHEERARDDAMRALGR
jgi:hypothetical protein